MKRRKLLKNKTASYIAVSILTLALAGVTCGTFAWFNYDTRTPVSELDGISIGLGGLDVGFISSVELTDADQHGLQKDDSNPDETIYWFSGHSMEPETLSYILEKNGYATNELYPLTSRKYDQGDDFSLYSTPRMDLDDDEETIKSGHINLSLVFRYFDVLEDELISNENIYLSKFEIKTEDEETIAQRAIRIYTNDKAGHTHLINPNSNENGYTDVGGILDLNGDGYYDCTKINDVYYEYVYGETSESTYREALEVIDSEISEDEITSFNAKHKAGTIAIDSFTPEVANYEGYYSFKDKTKPVTTTNPNTNNYAYLDLSIYVEGWDLNVIDSQIGTQVAINLRFDVKF